MLQAAAESARVQEETDQLQSSGGVTMADLVSDVLLDSFVSATEADLEGQTGQIQFQPEPLPWVPFDASEGSAASDAHIGMASTLSNVVPDDSAQQAVQGTDTLADFAKTKVNLSQSISLPSHAQSGHTWCTVCCIVPRMIPCVHSTLCTRDHWATQQFA